VRRCCCCCCCCCCKLPVWCWHASSAAWCSMVQQAASETGLCQVRCGCCSADTSLWRSHSVCCDVHKRLCRLMLPVVAAVTGTFPTHHVPRSCLHSSMLQLFAPEFKMLHPFCSLL
jgi:hypothetical protein